MIDVVILAGGLGTRLKSVIPDLPKVLSPIHGRPFLDYVLDFLKKSELINQVILAVGYMADQIIHQYVNRCDEYNFKVLFSKENMPLGTGGAIKKALSMTNSDEVLILNGDSYIDFDIDNFINFHRKKDSLMTIILTKVNDTQRYGSVTIDENFRILSFKEKSKENENTLINAGGYLINKNIFDDIKEDREISFEREILPELLSGKAYGYLAQGGFIDIGIPEDYRQAQKKLSNIIKNYGKD